jgi:hypothetical protein
MVSSRKSNTFTDIFEHHWDKFKTKYPAYNSEHYNSVVSKMLSCGDPSEGFIEYQCTYCGKENHIIGFSCKSSLCLKCGAIRAFDFVEEVMAKLHSGIIYRHLTLTIPEQLRSLFYKNRHDKEFYNLFYKVGWDCICNFLSWLTGIPLKSLKGGCIIVMHIPGRDAKYNPHLHIILMNGALNMIKNKWMNLCYFPYKVLRKKWQYFLSKMIVEFDPSPETKKLIDNLWKKYGKIGFVFNIDKKDVPKRSEALAKYLSKYLFRPSISVKRILEYDKENKLVVYEYACHETGETERTEVSVYNFIGKMVQQILPKGFQRVRYMGLQASSSYKKSKEQIHDAFNNGTELIRDGKGEVLVKKAAQLNFREKILKWKNKDPLRCKQCGRTMELVRVWIKGKGYVFDLFEEMKTGPPEIDFLRKKSDDQIVLNETIGVQQNFFA